MNVVLWRADFCFVSFLLQLVLNSHVDFFHGCIFFPPFLHRCVDLALFSVTQYVRFLLHICITIPFSLAFVPSTHTLGLRSARSFMCSHCLFLFYLYAIFVVVVFIFVLRISWCSIALAVIFFQLLLQCFKRRKKNVHKIPKKVIQYSLHAVLFIKESKSYTQT